MGAGGGKTGSGGREGNHREIEGKGGGRRWRREGGKLLPGQDWLEIAAAQAGGACGPRSPPGSRAEPVYGLGGRLKPDGASPSVIWAAAMTGMSEDAEGKTHKGLATVHGTLLFC